MDKALRDIQVDPNSKRHVMIPVTGFASPKLDRPQNWASQPHHFPKRVLARSGERATLYHAALLCGLIIIFQPPRDDSRSSINANRANTGKLTFQTSSRPIVEV
jgi:hypothetical protein